MSHTITRPKPSAAELSTLAMQMYQQSSAGLRNEASLAQKAARKASATLLCVAILKALGLLLALALPTVILGVTLKRYLIVSETILTALMWILWVWSHRAPLGPAIAGLALCLTVWAGEAATKYELAVQLYGADQASRYMLPTGATLVRFIIGAALIGAIRCGVRHRRLFNQATLAAGREASTSPSDLHPASTATRFTGVATSFALFMVYMYLPMNLRVLKADGELTSKLIIGHLIAWSVITIVWSIACWRDVYRRLATPINPGWYFGAILAGVCTFLFASVSLRWFSEILQLPYHRGDDLSANLGLGMYGLILAVALQPAVCEELAFRGIIFSGLGRWLGGKETVLATAIMFMAIHMNPPAFPHLLLTGLILGVFRWRSGSWLPGVFLHFTHNFLCVVLPQM